MSGVGCRVSGVGCRVSGVGSGTVLAPLLHNSGTVPGTVPALAWPSKHPVYALVDTRAVRVLGTHPWHTRPPRVHHPAPAPTVLPVIAVPPLAAPAGWPLGSLLAAPMARLLGHVTWPVTGPAITPLIGTLVSAPCVTRNTAITASTDSYTLL